MGAPSANEWCDDAASTSEVDDLLAGVGYRVRSSDLQHVAQGLERLESAMVADCFATAAVSEGVHHNPGDMLAWVDSMLSELNDPVSSSGHLGFDSNFWSPAPAAQPILTASGDEEDSSIRLVHLLMSCADAIQCGDSAAAAAMVEEMGSLLQHVNTGFGMGKVAGYFADALTRRIYGGGCSAAAICGSPEEHEILYSHFYEASPYLKFAHFTANQAILEAFEGHDHVHVIDFGLMQGLQWPALIQALALRPGGPPTLRLTGIGPPSPDGRDSLREVGLRLAELARSVNVRFAFRGVAAARLEDVQPWMLQVAPGEAVAVNSVMQLHRLLSDPESLDSVLEWIAGLKPKVVTVVEQEADHNKLGFLDRFTEALFYYSTLFDSLEAESSGCMGASKAVAEMYLQREICDIVCCEGVERVERHEPLSRWRARLSAAGLQPLHLGSNAFRQARMLLSLFSRGGGEGEGHCVEEVDGCLTLGWHNRPLFTASAWRPIDGPAPSQAAADNIIPHHIRHSYMMRYGSQEETPLLVHGM